MTIRKDLADTVGNTPLIRLKGPSEATGCEILGKAEFLNPGQSVKDRAALYIIRDAVASGSLKPGGTIVEGTAGNTGIGLALVGASMGFRLRDRHPRDAEPGKEGHAAAGGGGARPGACGALQESQQLRPLLRAAGEPSWPRPSPTVPSGQTSSTTSPTAQAHIETHRPGNLGTDRWRGRWLHLLGRHRRHAGRRRHGAPAQGREDRACRPRGLGDLFLLHQRRVFGRRQFDHRRHRAGAR